MEEDARKDTDYVHYGGDGMRLRLRLRATVK